MSSNAWAWTGLIARLILGGVLIAAGASKASSPHEEFAEVINAYQVVSPDAADSLAALLPWAELVLGFALVLGCFTPAASAGAGAALIGFLGAIVSTKIRGIELPNCGCFGTRFHPSTTHTLIMDALLMLAAYAAFKHGRRRLSLDNWADGGYTTRR